MNRDLEAVCKSPSAGYKCGAAAVACPTLAFRLWRAKGLRAHGAREFEKMFLP